MFITKWTFLRHLTSVYWDSSVSCYSGLEDRKWSFESLGGNSSKAQGSILPPLCNMRPSFFRVVARSRLVADYRRFGAAFRSNFPGLGSARRLNCFTREDGTGDPETLRCQNTPANIPEQRRPQEFILSPQRGDRFWGMPSFTSSGRRQLFPH